MAASLRALSKSKNSLPKIFAQTPLDADGSIPVTWQPATDALTFNPDFLHPSPSTTSQWLFVWANHFRANGDDNPPVVNGRGFRYTSLIKANMATLAKLRAAFLGPAYARQLCGNCGLRYVLWGDTEALDQAPLLGGHYRDVAYCPPYVKDRVAGYVLDYEVIDKRSPAVTSAFFKRLAGETFPIVRVLYTNQVWSPGYVASGLSGIEEITAGQFHGVCVLQDHDERVLPRQLQVFGSRARKAVVTVDLKTNSLASVQYAHNIVIDRQLTGVNLWRNGADLTAPATKAKLDLFQPWVTS